MKQGDATPDARRRALDREINRVKSRIEMAYRRAMADFIITHQKLRGNPEQYNRQIEALAERYRQQVRIEIEKVITEYRRASADRYAGVYAQLSGVGAGQWAEAFKGAYALSPEVSAAVDRAGMQFLREMELYDRLLNVSGTDIGTLQGGHLSARQFSELMFLKNNTLAASKAGIDLHEWRKGVYGIDTLEPSSALFGQQIAREMVTDDYRMQNAFGQKIPEVLGFRISVCPTNKRGLARTHDICDELAGDYPKDFVFTGWHYNCRCLSQPIIDRAYLTAELEAMGFVGVDKGTKIAVPERTTKLITGQMDRYREAYPALVQANYVRFRGQERLMSEMEADELLTYHFEDFVEKNSTQGFLQGTSGLDVGITEPSDPEVFMDTRLNGDRYRFNVSSLDAADGHNPARDALSAFQAAGTGRPLTRSEISAAQDITHEMVHTMGRDASYAELAGQYPERLDELVNFTTDPGSAERQALEMVTEWYAREIFPQVAANQRWTLPADYARYLGTGYVNSVANLQTFLEYLPNGGEVRQRLAELLRRGDKAFAYRYLQDIIRESGVLKSGRKPGPVLNKMLGEQDPEAFRAYMDGAARAENVQVAQGIRQAAVAAVADQMGEVAGRLASDADYVRLGQNPQETAKRLGQGLKVEKNGLLNVRAESFLRGGRMLALGAPAVVISASVRENTSPTGNDPESAFPHYTRYVPPIIYRMGGHMTGVTAGMIDGAIDMGLETKNMMADIAKFGLSAAVKAGQVISPSPAGTVGAYGAAKYDEIVAKGDALLSELKDFIVLYINDKDFRTNILQALGDELQGYFSRLAGVSGEQGYAQGRLIVDIGSFLFGLGELKGITSSWKRLKKIDFTGVLSKLKKPEQKVIKTENIKYIDDAFSVVEEHAPKPKGGESVEIIPHTHRLIHQEGSNSVVNTPEGTIVKSNMKLYGYKPGEFITKGFDPQDVPFPLKEKMLKEIKDNRAVTDVFEELVRSGKGMPRVVYLSKPMTLYKIVKKGRGAPEYSKFWMTESELRRLLKRGKLEQESGIPLASVGEEYEIYKITTNFEEGYKKIAIFESEVAPTIENGYETIGGAKQILVPDRNQWTEAEKVYNFIVK